MSAGTVPHCPSGEEPKDSPLKKNKNQVKSDFLVSGAKFGETGRQTFRPWTVQKFSVLWEACPSGHSSGRSALNKIARVVANLGMQTWQHWLENWAMLTLNVAKWSWQTGKLNLGKFPAIWYSIPMLSKSRLWGTLDREEADEEFLFESYVYTFTGITISKTSLIL